MAFIRFDMSIYIYQMGYFVELMNIKCIPLDKLSIILIIESIYKYVTDNLIKIRHVNW